MSDTEEAPLEKPKKVLSPKQQANLAAGRAKAAAKRDQGIEEKANKKLEARFDRLLELFDQVKMPPPDVQQKLKVKKIPEPESESEDDEEPPPVKKKKGVERPKPVVHVQPDRTISFSFR